MTREVRAVVLGLIVVVLVALALARWNRPGREFSHIRGFRVEVREKDGDATRKVSFRVPVSLVARIASMMPLEKIRTDMNADWGRGDVSVRDILDAAERSAPGKPGVIKKEDTTVEVLADGQALEIDVKDDWDKSVHVRLPRVLIEGLSDEHHLSTHEILRRLDEMGPGDVVIIKQRDNQVTITAEPRRGLHVS
jgi:hypothetical protein